MYGLTTKQRQTVAEFFTNGAVAWLTVGVITPILTGQSINAAVFSFGLGASFTIFFLIAAIQLSKGGRI